VDWSALDGDGSGQLEGREVGAAVELVRLLVVAELGVTVGERPVLLGRAPARRDGPAGEPLGLLDPVALTVEASLPAPPFWDHLDLAVRHLPAEPGVVVPVSLRWGEGLTVDGLSAHRAERRGAGRVEAVMTWSQPWLRATVRRLEVGSAPAPQPVAKP
jgi:hypothetical protein